MEEHTFELLLNGLPYVVKVMPYKFNDQYRYKINYNGAEETNYVWDPKVRRLMPIEDSSSTTPDDLIAAISNKIESGNY